MSVTFAHPEAFWLLQFLPLVFLGKAVADYRIRRQRMAFEGALARSSRSEGPWSWLVLSLYGLAWLFFCGAMARPQAGEERIEAIVESRQLLFAVDVSKSMLAQDLSPDRLSRSKLLCQDLLRLFPDDRIGLIAFAGTSFLQAPLTSDHEAVSETIDQLEPSLIPRGGTNLSRAIRLAVDTFEKENAGSQALILISDGDELEGEAAATAKEARDRGIRVIAVGAGTEDGSLVPDPEVPGEFVRDPVDNAIVRSRLQPGTLREVARITDGAFFFLTGDPDLASRIAEPLTQLEASSSETKVFVKPLERFHWPLAFGILLAALAWILDARLSRPAGDGGRD
jgi:Ca-activated chloride channel family protein